MGIVWGLNKGLDRIDHLVHPMQRLMLPHESKLSGKQQHTKNDRPTDRRASTARLFSSVVDAAESSSCSSVLTDQGLIKITSE